MVLSGFLNVKKSMTIIFMNFDIVKLLFVITHEISARVFKNF